MAGRPVRIAVLSDLHLEIRRRHLLRAGLSEAEAAAAVDELLAPAREAARGADLAVIAGDVDNGAAAFRAAAGIAGDVPAVYVAGNHEFYRHEVEPLLAELRAAAAGGATRFLEDESAAFDLGGRRVRVLGCTLWTDYALLGAEAQAGAMAQAAETILDHRRITCGGGAPFVPADAMDRHRRSRAWLERALGSSFDGATVVVTHHAPSGASIAPQFRGDPLSPAFASDLNDLIERSRPAVWIHGHTHHDVDYRIGTTRVLSRQWGYPSEALPLTAAIVAL